MTIAELEAAIVNQKAIILVKETRQAGNSGGVSSFSIQGRQVTYSDSLDLERAYARLERLEALLARAQRGGGIPVRYGVVGG